MKRLIATLVSVIAVSAFADTNSNSGFYVGLGASNTKSDVSYLDENGGTHKLDFTPVEIFGGYKLSPFVGGEVRVGSSSGTNKINNFESVYYRVESANTVGKTYLLAGYSHVEVDTKSAGSVTLNGASYGAGMGFIINDDFNLNLEYKILATGSSTNYISSTEKQKIDLKLSSVSVTVDYRF